jgi:exodeoxyribonuclease V beta subunit
MVLAELLQQAAASLPGEHALLRWLRDQLESPDGNAEEQKLRWSRSGGWCRW